MKQYLVFFVALTGIVAGAAAFRLPGLSQRPMHADEAVQAAIFRTLWQQGRYTYNPDEFHGPTLAYATLPSVWIEGASDFSKTSKATFRVVTVCFGVGLILLLALLADGLGKAATLCAATLTAVSPAMVFYNRYYIHESLLVFFVLATIAATWRYLRTGRLRWMVAAGVSLGLMQATKETSLLVYVAMGVAYLLTIGWSRLTRAEADQSASCHGDRGGPFWHWGLGLFVAFSVAALLLSSLATNPRGPWDGILTYAAWFNRSGTGSIHAHRWYYFLQLLTWRHPADGPVWTEGMTVLLAWFGFILALFPSGRSLPGVSVSLVRWLGFYSITLIAIYSVIPYKTPWCLMGPLSSTVLLAGVGAVSLVRIIPTWPGKGIVVLILLAGAGHLGWQAYQASFPLSSDAKNPFLYVRTLPDVERLARDVVELAEADEQEWDVPINVIWNDPNYWPLPWYLRRFRHVGYWTDMPTDPAAPIVIASPEYDARLTSCLESTHLMTGYYAIRPNVMAMLWVRMDLWEAHLRRLGRL